MPTFSNTLTAIALLLITNTVVAAPIPNFTAIYDVTKSGVALGEMKSTLITNQDKGYTYSSITEPTGIASWFSSEKITESSKGVTKNNQFIPSTYIFTRSGGKKEVNTEITFDYKKNTAIDKTNDNTIKIDIDNSITDRQIVQVLLMNDMIAGKTKLEYKVINKQEVKPYVFTIVGDEKIDTEIGIFKTTAVSRKREGSSRVTTLWLAHDLYYLPVKIKQTKDGSTKFEMDITKLTGIKVPKADNSSNTMEPAI